MRVRFKESEDGFGVVRMKLVTQRVRDADEALNNGTRGVSWTPKEAADDKQPSRYALKCKMGQSNV